MTLHGGTINKYIEATGINQDGLLQTKANVYLPRCHMDTSAASTQSGQPLSQYLGDFIFLPSGCTNFSWFLHTCLDQGTNQQPSHVP